MMRAMRIREVGRNIEHIETPRAKRVPDMMDVIQYTSLEALQAQAEERIRNNREMFNSLFADDFE